MTQRRTSSRNSTDRQIHRRTLLAASAAGISLLAGCSGDGGGGTGGDDGGGGSGSGGTGRFRLLISDQPTAIDEFDSLTVTLDRARVFRADEDETVTESAGAGTPEGNETVTETEDGEDEEDEQGFVEFDLDGASVDLTQVTGDRAVSVLEGELEAGRYSGIELFVASAEGVVEGEDVEVMVPSNRLRIIKPFEVAADAELSFVFDITVVKRGQQDSYNLTPVIGKSGVVGEDVEVEENAGENDADGEDGSGGDQGGNQSQGGDRGEDGGQT